VLFRHYELSPEKLSDLQDICFSMILEAYVLLWFVFEQVLGDFPFLFILMLRSDEDAQRISEQFFRTYECCREKDFAAKVYRLFGSPAALKSSVVFRQAIRLWAKNQKVCNMHVERLLALIKKASSSCGYVHIERMMGAGFLTQLLVAHKNAGGSDPRNITAHKMENNGVVTLGSLTRDKTRKPSVGALTDSQRLCAARNAYCAHALQQRENRFDNKKSYYEFRKHKFREFPTLAPEAQAPFFAQVDPKHVGDTDTGLMADDGECSNMCPPLDYDHDKLWGLSSTQLPLDRDVFLQHVDAVADDKEFVGRDKGIAFYRWGRNARTLFQKKVFVEDRGSAAIRRTTDGWRSLHMY
jgi:hypothetical protein